MSVGFQPIAGCLGPKRRSIASSIGTGMSPSCCQSDDGIWLVGRPHRAAIPSQASRSLRLLPCRARAARAAKVPSLTDTDDDTPLMATTAAEREETVTTVRERLTIEALLVRTGRNRLVRDLMVAGLGEPQAVEV